MTTSTLTLDRPNPGPIWDKSKPETRQPWLDFRRPGLTATMIRDWGNGSRRRKILEEKATGVFEDLSHIAAVDHGNRREPVISAWIEGRFGITPCERSFSHPENVRYLASPDGISLDPFSGELIVGTDDAVLSEIKTSKHDLMPGMLDDTRTLMEIEPGSDFDRSNYYTQIQWQMFVMNATRTLFVWEQHDGTIDPETDTFRPVGPPQWVWIPRNQGLIDALLENVAPKALAEIDVALTIRSSELPPASEFPAEDAVLVADLLKAREREATAKASKEAAWKTLQDKYLGGDDQSVDLGFATFTVSTSTPTAKVYEREVTDWEAMRKRAPKLTAQYEALKARYTKIVPEVVPGTPTQRLTITEKKIARDAI